MRVRGGFRGILAAIDAERLDPDDGATPQELPFIPYTKAERRAQRLREHRRKKKASKLAPF